MEKESVLTIDFQHLIDSLISKIGSIIPNLIGAIIWSVVGVWLIRLSLRLIRKAMERRGVDTTVQIFVNQLAKWVLYIILFLAIVQILGVPVTSFLGALTASAVAIGLALQGSLSNFAGGIMLLILKPFKVGDVIQVKGETGTVQRIGMFYTKLNKFGNEQAIIPNGPLFADNIINFSAEETRRVKIMVGIAYSANIKLAKEILLHVAESCPTALKEPAPAVYVEELADNSVNLSVRVWSKTTNYWDAYFYMIENIKFEFDKAQIEIPFPQRDVYIHKVNN